MRRVILNPRTTDALGRSCQVLKSVEDGTRGTDLRALRLYFGHPQEIRTGHPIWAGRSDEKSGLLGAVPKSEPSGSGEFGPGRCWQMRRLVESRAHAGKC